jgi:glycosyltransferase involved in cell wall biosynthesis
VPDAQRRRLLVCAANFHHLLIHRAGLFRALQNQGFEIVVAAPEGRGAAELRQMGVRTEVLPFDPTGISPIGDLMLLRRFRALMKRLKPAAFIAFTVKPNIYGSVAARRVGVPSINNISGLGRVFVSRTLLTRLVERLYRWGFRKSCVVFFENRDDEQLFLERRIVRPDQAVPLAGAGLDLELFSPRRGRRKKGAPFTFLLAARLLWHKGVREFVDAARRVGSEHPDTEFRILGFVEPPGRDSVPEAMLRSWADEGVIDYAGGTADVRPMIAAADCVVLPTFYREGVPRILMEAAAMAKPVIATDMPGCLDAVDHGVTGFICAPKSAQSLAEAMGKMLRLGSDQRQQMGREGRAKMERQFKEEFVHRAYVEALDRCGAGAAHGRS